jgi:DNA repair protein RadD
MLRPYQKAAVDAIIGWVRTSYEPCLLDAATGAGKSHIIASVAHWVNNHSGKKVLCLAPSKELVEQNHAKYLATGNPASIYCASISKSLAHDVVFGSPQSVKKALYKFGDDYAAIIVDEAHGITPTVQDIIEHIRKQNKKIRVIGLTATPYRMGMGYIYQYDVDGNPVPEDSTKNPYFNKLVYRITARELIDKGYLTNPVFEPTTIQYDTESLTLDKKGNFDSREVERVFEGQGRKTSKIIEDAVANSFNRKGVMIFAATIQHAVEVMESLDQDNARLITGKTSKTDREKTINDFKNKRFKYLVNVAVLTTGFDASHVDHIVILRATESAGLLQQIIGRGLRLDDNKPDCLVSDYAKNIERHCPGGDVFDPRISVSRGSSSFDVECQCPLCKTKNIFVARKNDEGFDIDKNGYFLDLLGNRVLTDDGKEMPAHHGRRCYGQSIVKGESVRCEYRWTFKECRDCGHENDIAARYCESCKGELVDPNEKLVIEFHKMKSNPYEISTDKIKTWLCRSHISQRGNETLKVTYTTDYRTFDVYYFPSSSSRHQRNWESLCYVVFGRYISSPSDFMDLINDFEGKMPTTITAARQRGSDFYTVYDHNRSEDEVPTMAAS